jgi:hypothetical protein
MIPQEIMCRQLFNWKKQNYVYKLACKSPAPVVHVYGYFNSPFFLVLTCHCNVMEVQAVRDADDAR